MPIIMKHIILFPLLSAVLISCISEIDSEDREEYRTTSVNISDWRPENGRETKSTLTIDPSQISNIQTFAFDPSTGEIMKYGKNAGAALEGKPVTAYMEGAASFEWCLPVRIPLDIYAVANIGQIDTPSRVEELLANERLHFDFRNMEDLNKLTAMPMSGILNITLGTDDSDLSIPMKKLLAKYNISIFFADMKSTKVHRLTIRNAHRNVRLFGKDEAAQGLSDIVTEMDYTTTKDLETLNSGGSISLYLPENMQTTVNGATSDATDWRNISPENMIKGNLNLCSYLEVSYNYSEFGNNIEEGRRKVYFGKSPASDFDVERNKETAIRINIKDPGPSSFCFLSETYLKIPEGESIKCSFTHNGLTAEQLKSSFFTTGDSRLTLSGFSANADGTGSVLITAKGFTKTSESWIRYDCPDPAVAPSQLTLVAEFPEKPKNIYYKYSVMERAQGSFLYNPVYADYGNGHIFEVSDKCTFSSANESIASYKGPGESFDKGYGYFLTSTNSGYGISFGDTIGETDITATYMGLETSFHAITQKEEVWYEAEPASLDLRYGETAEIKVYKRTNTNRVKFFDIKREGAGTTSKTYPELKGELSSGLGSVSAGSQNNVNPCIFTVTAGNTSKQGTLSLKKRMYSTDPSTGKQSYIYSIMGGISIPVRVWPADDSWGTLLDIRIDGPDRVIADGDGVFSAIATYRNTDGETVEIDLTTKGSWSSDGFGSYVGNGVFLDAATDYRKDHSKKTTVRFTYNGVTATKDVSIYKYSVFETSCGLSSNDTPGTWNETEIVVIEKVYSEDGLVFTDECSYTWNYGNISGYSPLYIRQYTPIYEVEDLYENMRKTMLTFTIRTEGYFFEDGSVYPNIITISDMFYNDGFIHNGTVIW